MKAASKKRFPAVLDQYIKDQLIILAYDTHNTCSYSRNKIMKRNLLNWRYGDDSRRSWVCQWISFAPPKKILISCWSIDFKSCQDLCESIPYNITRAWIYLFDKKMLHCVSLLMATHTHNCLRVIYFFSSFLFFFFKQMKYVHINISNVCTHTHRVHFFFISNWIFWWGQ